MNQNLVWVRSNLSQDTRIIITIKTFQLKAKVDLMLLHIQIPNSHVNLHNLMSFVSAN